MGIVETSYFNDKSHPSSPSFFNNGWASIKRWIYGNLETNKGL